MTALKHTDSFPCYSVTPIVCYSSLLHQHLAKPRLPPVRGIAVEDMLLGGGIDSLENARKELGCFLHLPFFHEIHVVAHHRLEVRLVGEAADATKLVLLHSLDGGLDDRHRARRSYAKREGESRNNDDLRFIGTACFPR